jgi:hypothetical protein
VGSRAESEYAPVPALRGHRVISLEEEQRKVCATYASEYVPSAPDSVCGVSKTFDPLSGPIHGLRHPVGEDTSGWYIWTGEYSADDDFFIPLHVWHLADMCPAVPRYLGLAPGWRFLVAPDHLDIWYDEILLAV